VGNWPQSPEGKKAKKNRVTTRRQTGTLVRLLSEVTWIGKTKKKTMDSAELLRQLASGT